MTEASAPVRFGRRLGIQRKLGLAAAVAIAVRCAGPLPPPRFESFDPSTLPGPDDYPDARAVVLLDRGELRFSVDPKLANPLARLRRLRRLRVLRPEPQAPTVVDARVEPTTRVVGFRVRVSRPDGRVDTYRDPRSARDEDGVEVQRFEIPGLEAGAVVEAIYDTWFTDLRFIPPWRFDDRYPTGRSEYAVIAPSAFSIDLRFSEAGAFVDRPPDRFDTPEGVRFSWSLRDLPARFPEPQMPDPELLAPRAHVIWQSTTSGSDRRLGFNTWDDVGRWLLARTPDWAELSAASVAEARRVAGEVSEEEKALRLFEVVARDLGWPPGPPAPTWRESPAHPDALLARGFAGPTGRGLVLVALLRAVGLTARPVLFARRDADVLLPDAPTVRSLDGVLAEVILDDRTLMLNPSELTAGARVPPPSLQGQRVVILLDDAAELVRVPTSAPEDSQTEVTYTLRLDSRGDLSGQLEARLTGAEAGQLRARVLETPPQAYADEIGAFLAARGAPIPVSSVSIADLRVLRRPLVIRGTVAQPAVVPIDEDTEELFVPLARVLVGEPPTPAEVRRAPRVLGAPRAAKVTATLTLPEGWRAVFAPPDERVAGPGIEARIGARIETQGRLGFVFEERRSDLSVPPRTHYQWRRYMLNREAAAHRTFGVARPPERSLRY